MSHGSLTDPFREWMLQVPDELAAARARGQEVVYRPPVAPPGHVVRLMAALGVRIEVEQVSVQERVKSRGELAQDHRASVASAARREEGFEDVAVCPECACEIDVPAPAHAPRCPRLPTTEAPPVGENTEHKREKGRDGILRSTNERHSDGSLTSGEMQRRHDARMDAATLTTLCGITGCGWRYEGAAADGRAAAVAHRETAHPAFGKTTRRKPPRPAATPAPEPAEKTVTNPALDALARMDAGEPQVAVRTAETADRSATPTKETPPMPATDDRSPRRLGAPHAWTRETAIAAVQAFAERHGRPPKANEAGTRNALPANPPRRDIAEGWAHLIELSGFARPSSGGPGPKRQVRVPQAPEAAAPPPARVEPSPSPGTVTKESPRPAATEPGTRTDEKPAGTTERRAITYEIAAPDRLEFSLALTGDFARDAQRVRDEAELLRRQAQALDAIANGIDQLTETQP